MADDLPVRCMGTGHHFGACDCREAIFLAERELLDVTGFILLAIHQLINDKQFEANALEMIRGHLRVPEVRDTIRKLYAQMDFRTIPDSYTPDKEPSHVRPAEDPADHP